MKKLLFAIALLFTLTACSSANSSAATESDTDSTVVDTVQVDTVL